MDALPFIASLRHAGLWRSRFFVPESGPVVLSQLIVAFGKALIQPSQHYDD